MSTCQDSLHQNIFSHTSQKRSSQEAISILGLGTWRLRGRLGGAFEALAAQLEGAWRAKVKDLGLFTLPQVHLHHHCNRTQRSVHMLDAAINFDNGCAAWQDLKFVDSLDADKSFGMWSYVDVLDPEKGGDGYPRLLIENRAYKNRVFRKLHMELAHRQDGLQVRQ